MSGFVKSAGFVKRSLYCLAMIWLAVASTFAQANFFNSFGSSNGPIDVEEAFVLSSSATNGELTLRWQMPDDYYLYRDKVSLELPEGITLADRQFGPAELKSDPLFGDVFVYYHEAQLSLRLIASPEVLAAVEAAPAQFAVTYQGCWDGGLCYPPVTKQVDLDPSALLSSDAAAELIATRTNSVPGLSVSSDQASASSVAPQSEQSYFSDVLKGKSLWVVLALFFVAGLALSFTPCVFPMLPIISSLIAGQGKVTWLRAFALSWVYVLSVAITYTAMGVLAGMLGANLQALFQAPWLIVAFSLVFVALSLSMFGLYELQVPSSIQSRLAQVSGSQQGGQVLSVAVMGVLSALIVGPCMAAPLAGALLYISETGDPLLGGAALFSMSLGMGVPLLVVGTSAGSLLPKAGAWMSAVKAGFGVALLLMAVWMLSRILPFSVTVLLVVLILTVACVWAIFFTAHTGAFAKLAKGVLVLVLVYTMALFAGLLAGQPHLLNPLKAFTSGGPAQLTQGPALEFHEVTTPEQLDALLAQAKGDKRAVMLDFYADWCISCIELEQVTFKDPAVVSALSPLTLIRVDVTANDEASKALYQRYTVMGPPALIFVDQEGNERKDMMLVGTLSAQALVNHLGYLR